MMDEIGYVPEPYRIKAVEPVRVTSRDQRRELIAQAGYNPFLLRAEDVYIDLLTDSGTGSMSDRQWAAMMMGDEAYAGSKSFFRFSQSVQEVLGFPQVVPTHQGRAAEHLLFMVLVKPGQLVLNNMHFDTTKAHVLHRRGVPVDLAGEAAYIVQSDDRFKGNMDIDALDRLLADRRDDVALIMMTLTCNSAGGQPVSMANLRQVRRLADQYDLPFFIDACRFAENAHFIKQREPGYENTPLPDIVLEMMSLADGCTMSAKKDGLANIGGFLATRDPEIHRQASQWAVLFEGFPTYGGLAGRDMDAIACGLREVLDEAYLAHRVGQVDYVCRRLSAADIPVVMPPGGHAVYVDAGALLPGMPRDRFPAWALTVELYIEAGIRCVEIGTVMAGRSPDTGDHDYPRLELVRLAIPRRTYTQAHLDTVVQALIDVAARAGNISGYRFVSEPPILRHFVARFEPLTG